MIAPRTLAAVILAAGASTRLGRPKQLVRWGEETLLERVVRIAEEAGCVPFVVLGYAADRIRASCDLSRSEVVINPEWQQGMGGSIRVGIEAAQAMGATAVIVMTCDQPAVTAQHLRRLGELGAEGSMVASAYAGRKGGPACFPSSCFNALQAIQGDSGARELLQHAAAIDLPFGELDIDTEDKLRLAQELLLQKQD